MRLIFTALFALFLSTTVSCGKGKTLKRTERGGLSETDYTALKNFNSMAADNMDAIYSVSEPRLMLSEKARGLASKIEGAGCMFAINQLPSKNMEREWQAEQKYESPGGGSNCPIALYRKWVYRTRDTRELSMAFNYYSRLPEYERLSGITSITSTGGNFFVQRNSSNNINILRGQMAYDFKLHGGGKARAEVSTLQEYQGIKGGGFVRVQISGAAGAFVGEIRWDASDFNDRTYLAGGKPIFRENFMEIFSFFGLDEIVDYSAGMR